MWKQNVILFLSGSESEQVETSVTAVARDLDLDLFADLTLFRNTQDFS